VGDVAFTTVESKAAIPLGGLQSADSAFGEPETT